MGIETGNSPLKGGFRMVGAISIAGVSDYDGDFGGVAQLGEHLLCKQRVMGSSPFTSTRKSIQNKFEKGLAA